MPPITLIQLISDQTIQNLLPILRLRPARLVHLVTPRVASKSDLLRRAVKAAGILAELEVVRLSAMPGIPESYRAVHDVISQTTGKGRVPVVNFTGGTKLMGIGAYAAAKDAQVPSLYVDTDNGCFMDGATSPEMGVLLGQDWSFTPVRKQLRVDVIGMANGVDRITGSKDWKAMLPLASHLFSHREDEEATHQALHGPEGIFPWGKEPRTPTEWMKCLDRPIALPEDVARLAAEVGLLRGDGNGACLLPDGTREDLEALSTNQVTDFKNLFYRAVSPLQHASAFLSGAWWEVVVGDALDRSGLVRDLRWSALVGAKDGPDQEDDLLGLDGVQLVYVSCKRGGSKARLMPHLEELCGRAETIGGRFSRKFLAVYALPGGGTERNLLRRAREKRVQVIHPGNLEEAGVFARAGG